MAEVPDCVLFSTADWDAPYWTNKQHTAHQLAQRGYRVLYVESVGLRAPTANRKDIGRIWRRLQKGLQKPRQVEKNIWVLAPLLIPFKHHWKIIRWMNQSILAWQIKMFMQRQQFQRALVWTYHPFILETIQRFGHDKLVYHSVDDLSAVPGIDPVAFKREETRLLKTADIVFVTSQTLYRDTIGLNANTHYLGNVADLEHFSQAQQSGSIPDDLARIPPIRIGYIGALSDYKIDFGLILQIAQQKPEWHWVLIGDEREGQHNPLVHSLRQLSNVHFMGHRAYADLPAYLRGIDVATLPSLLNDYTRSMFPMKYFEYLAAGVPVVATPLEFTRTNTAGMLIAATPAEFIAAIEQQLARGRFSLEESMALVADNTWETRLDKMLRCLAVISQ